ncbi:MAG: magnesium protoporphyrin IX methyltransferase [Oscillochloris sp.]|nr:magnesium protoporphyrin IX methyltransferase [Oscillochloris sp.]
MDIAQHKARLRTYFDGIGFQRWSAIYGEEELSRVRRTIRDGHRAMLARACTWLDADRLPAQAAVLDAGCGTGLFSLELARRGYRVTAADIAEQMVSATAERLLAADLRDQVHCVVSDLEALDGTYDLVACFDVLIHYPAQAFGTMLQHLAARSSDRLLFTYAPHSPLLALLHRIGGFFPHSQRRTDIQMVPDETVRSALTQAGMAINAMQRVNSGFYHVTLIEARRITSAKGVQPGARLGSSLNDS